MELTTRKYDYENGFYSVVEEREAKIIWLVVMNSNPSAQVAS